MENFIEKFKEQFEDPEVLFIDKDTIFKDLDTWDSLTAFSVQSMIEDEYDVVITNEELKKCNTVNELFELILSK